MTPEAIVSRATARKSAAGDGRASVERHGKMPQRALFAWTAALPRHIGSKPTLAAAAFVH
jgi:hypothetical protein